MDKKYKWQKAGLLNHLIISPGYAECGYLGFPVRGLGQYYCKLCMAIYQERRDNEEKEKEREAVDLLVSLGYKVQHPTEFLPENCRHQDTSSWGSMEAYCYDCGQIL